LKSPHPHFQIGVLHFSKTIMAKNLKPFVTVSREAGSGGKLVAKKLARELGFKLYDDELIKLIARKTKLRKKVVEKLDEKERGFMEDLLHRLLNPEYVSSQTYIKSLCQVIKALSLKGKVVILGRGGNFVTSLKNGLHVRVIAPFWDRVKYTMKYEKRSMKNAIGQVRKYDKERKEFIRQFFGKNPSNIDYYDLVLNTEELSVDEAVAVAAEAFKQKFKRRE